MKPTIALLLSVFVISLLQPVYAEESTEEFLAGFVAGKYHLIGKQLHSEDAYYGDAEIIASGKKLKIKKHIQGKTLIGTGAIESITADNILILRFRFGENTAAIEETCQIDSDFDNYARLTCHFYQKGEPTDSPGLEAMFINKNRSAP